MQSQPDVTVILLKYQLVIIFSFLIVCFVNDTFPNSFQILRNKNIWLGGGGEDKNLLFATINLENLLSFFQIYFIHIFLMCQESWTHLMALVSPLSELFLGPFSPCLLLDSYLNQKQALNSLLMLPTISL